MCFDYRMDYYYFAEAVQKTTEQTSNQPDLFWTIIASAFGGALITSAVTIWSKLSDSKSEHKRWLREEKLKAYSEYGKLTYECLNQVSSNNMEQEAGQTRVEIMNLTARISLLSSEAMYEECDAVQGELKRVISLKISKSADFRRARDKVAEEAANLFQKMQKDLGIKA